MGSCAVKESPYTRERQALSCHDAQKERFFTEEQISVCTLCIV